jgi:hypothetical protein
VTYHNYNRKACGEIATPEIVITARLMLTDSLFACAGVPPSGRGETIRAVGLTYGRFRLPGQTEKHKPPHPRLATPNYTKQHPQAQISDHAFSGA